MEHIKTYAGKGGQRRDGNRALAVSTWESVMCQNHLPINNNAMEKKPAVNNRQLRKRVQRTIKEKENIDESVNSVCNTSVASQKLVAKNNLMFCDLSDEECLRATKPKSVCAARQTKVKKTHRKAVTEKTAVSGKGVTVASPSTVLNVIDEPVRSFSEFDDYYLHISTDCVKPESFTIEHKVCATDNEVGLLQKEILAKIKSEKSKVKRGAQKCGKRSRQDKIVFAELAGNESIVEPEVSRSAELGTERFTPSGYVGEVSLCSSPRSAKDASVCCWKECSLSLSTDPILFNSARDCDEKQSLMSESLMSTADDCSSSFASQKYWRKHNSGGLTSTPHHVLRSSRYATRSRDSKLQVPDCGSISDFEDTDLSASVMPSHDAIHSVELFSPSTTDNMLTSGLSELKEIVDSLQVSLQQVMSLGQQNRVSLNSSNCTSQGSASSNEGSESASVEIQQPDQDVMTSFSDSNMCVDELSEILEEDEEDAEKEDCFDSQTSHAVDSINVNSAAYHSRTSHAADSIDANAAVYHNLSFSNISSDKCTARNRTELNPCVTPSLRGRNTDIEQLQLSNISFREMLSPTPRKSIRSLSSRDKVLLQCGQSAPIPFENFIMDNEMDIVKKIGEGVYGEVYSAVCFSREQVALKIIPIEGQLKVNDEVQKSFEEMLPEIMISKELSSLRTEAENQTENFVFVRSVHCLQGEYPQHLLSLWDEYDDAKQSQNDRPDSFPARQLYIVFEFENCGSDLESFKLNSFVEAKSVITQVSLSLAVAERSLNFEHRDLHWGNVLLARTNMDVIEYKLEGQHLLVKTHGIKVAIIDFTLSRLTKDGIDVYTSLSDEISLFEGQGDLQFQVYREMKRINGNNWQKYCPQTNILWIDYLCDKLLNHMRYGKASTNRSQHASLRKQLKQVRDSILTYDSACSLVHSKSVFFC